VFDIEDRDRVRDRVLDIASSDPRVVAGAVLGSLAHGEGDRWSDLDLMFAVADDVPITAVLEDWSQTVVREFGAIQLFDLASGPIIYRVFLFRSAWSLICRSRQPPSSARAGQSSSYCSATLVKSWTNHPSQRMNCSGTASTTPSMHESPSSEVGTGRLSTGSARYATRHSALLVADGVLMAGTAGTSTNCHPRFSSCATMHSCSRSDQTSSVVR
jgi:hypothetical protein